MLLKLFLFNAAFLINNTEERSGGQFLNMINMLLKLMRPSSCFGCWLLSNIYQKLTHIKMQPDVLSWQLSHYTALLLTLYLLPWHYHKHIILLSQSLALSISGLRTKGWRTALKHILEHFTIQQHNTCQLDSSQTVRTRPIAAD